MTETDDMPDDAEQLVRLKRIAHTVDTRWNPAVDVDDLVQWGWLAARQAQPYYNPNHGQTRWQFSAWCARRQMVHQLWKMRHIKAPHGETGPVVSLNEAAYLTGGEDPTYETELVDWLERLLRVVPGKARRCLVLRFMEELPLTDVAETLHMGRVGAVVQESLAEIRDWARHGGTDAQVRTHRAAEAQPPLHHHLHAG